MYIFKMCFWWCSVFSCQQIESETNNVCVCVSKQRQILLLCVQNIKPLLETRTGNRMCINPTQEIPPSLNDVKSVKPILSDGCWSILEYLSGVVQYLRPHHEAEHMKGLNPHVICSIIKIHQINKCVFVSPQTTWTWTPASSWTPVTFLCCPVDLSLPHNFLQSMDIIIKTRNVL